MCVCVRVCVCACVRVCVRACVCVYWCISTLENLLFVHLCAKVCNSCTLNFPSNCNFFINPKLRMNRVSMMALYHILRALLLQHFNVSLS